MTEQEQMRALLEWMGWTPRHQEKFDPLAMWGKPPGIEDGWKQCPPLTLDLMHEAERKGLQTNGMWKDYEDWLKSIIPYDFKAESRTIHATAPQRLEAFLRTVGLWKEKTK